MKNDQKFKVAKLPNEDIELVVDTFCDAFSEYPVMKYVLGNTSNYEAKYRKLIHFFVLNRVLKNEYMFGINDQGELKAVATVSVPYKIIEVPELELAREKIWQELGNEARSRYEQFGTICSQFDVESPHIHLNMIGVRKNAQGLGLGRLLLEHVHNLSSELEESKGVTLSTEVPENVDFYKYFGYEIIGQAEVGNAFTTWNFFRPNS